MACHLRQGSHHRASGSRAELKAPHLGRAAPCPRQPLSHAPCCMGPSWHYPEPVLQLVSRSIAAGGYGQDCALHTGAGDMSQAGGAEVGAAVGFFPGCGLLVGSAEGWAHLCHCPSLPVGFKNCISNFCCYFKKILPKAVCITDKLILQGMCGVAGAL